MIIEQRYLGQEELKKVYESAKKRMEYHPEKAEIYRRIIEHSPFYNDKDEAIKVAEAMCKSDGSGCQVWAKVGKDKEHYYIEDYYIVSNDYKILIAADYIGMEQIFID